MIYNRKMIADINISEKSFGDKILMTNVKFSIDDGEKIGIVGRNGIGKSTLFNILSGSDKDFSGEIVFRRGVSVASTAQEHHNLADISVINYILNGLPEYASLSKIINEYPSFMGDNIRLINEYSEALDRFNQKDFYQIEEKIKRELGNFQLENVYDQPMESLSGGQKRLVEIIKIMHSNVHLALIDEPTNHMDYVAKQQFIDWVKSQSVSNVSMLIITHDRDVLGKVDRIIELKNGGSTSYSGNYDSYLKQNAMETSSGMMNFEQVERRITSLKQKVLDYQRLKEKSRNQSTIQRFKRLENSARDELVELEKREKPSFWIDKDSIEKLNYKAVARYEKFKSKNIRVNLKSSEARSKRVVASAKNATIGYSDKILLENINIDLRENEILELRGRNGAGKTTLIKALLNYDSNLHLSNKNNLGSLPTVYDGELWINPDIRIGVYEQEISDKYLNLSLKNAIEQLYLDKNLPISDTKIRQLCSDYLFTSTDLDIPIMQLSGGQKARFQIISILANDPQLLILDEPTNHLDLPSIEELESALMRYSGAIIYVSHDNYFRQKLKGKVLALG